MEEEEDARKERNYSYKHFAHLGAVEKFEPAAYITLHAAAKILLQYFLGIPKRMIRKQLFGIGNG